MKTKYPFDDKTALKHKQETKEQSTEELLYQHDIKLQELDTRLNSLENLVNTIHQAVPVYWEVIEDKDK